MFDIREYCAQGWNSALDNSSEAIDTELASDIRTLLASAGGSLYLCDRYKNAGRSVDIIYPSAIHPGLYSYMLSPERLRFLLSLYPRRIDLERINRIVIRPRYIEAGEIELAALYMKTNRTLVLYLTSTGFGSGTAYPDSEFVSASLEKITMSKIITDSIEGSGSTDVKIPALWNIVSVIDPEGEGEMEKFFIRRPDAGSADISRLTEISSYYSGIGY